MGDFNMLVFDWDQFLHPDNFLHNSFADFICTHGLAQFVQEPNCGDSTFVFTVKMFYVLTMLILFPPPIENSDHSSIAFRLSVDHSVHGVMWLLGIT